MALTIAGCSSTGSNGGLGYIPGSDNVVETLKPADRSAAPEVTGTTLDGKPFSLSSELGEVVVINVWGSWCADCVAEQPGLVEAAHKLPGVAFLGIDIRDTSKAAARAYVRTYHVPYPSLYDPNGTALLSFYGTLPPNAIPTTLVLDAQGRVAARVVGRVTADTVEGLVHDITRGS